VASEVVIAWPQGERRYPLPTSYTYREMGTIKRITGLRAGEIEDALMAVDTEVIVCIALIAAERAGEQVDIDRLEDLDFGAIRVEVEDEGPTNAAPTDADESAGGDQETPTPTTPAPGGTPA